MKLVLIITAFIFTISCTSQDKNLSPLDITKHFFIKEGFKDKNKYVCCEMVEVMANDSTIGQTMPEYPNKVYKLIYMDSNAAVTSTELINKEDKQNVYLYFIKDSIWKIEAIRSFGGTMFTKYLLDLSKTISRDSLAKLLPQAKDIEFEINKAKLLSSTDTELMKYFSDNKDAFKHIVNLYFQKGYDKNKTTISINESEYDNPEKDKDIKDQLKKLTLINIGFDIIDPEGIMNGHLCLCIGGMLDNTAGFMYEPDKNKIPKISKDYFIIIRDLGDGWYLYKTT